MKSDLNLFARSGRIDPYHNVDISIIIVSWNACRFLEECLESVSHGITHTYEVIVVENASTDGSAEMVSARFPWVRLITNTENVGFSKGNNLGIAHSRGKYLALVNSDVHVLPSCLDQLALCLSINPEVGLVGPRIMYGDRRQQSSCRRFPTLWNNTCEVFGLNRLFPHSEFFASEEMFYFKYDQTMQVEVLVGCFIMARRAAIDQFGLLDEAFFMYCEDLDWCWRCWRAGWKVMFFPGAEAIHYCGSSSARDTVRFSQAQLQARFQLWAKYRSEASRASLLVLVLLQLLLRIAIAGLRSVLDRRSARIAWRVKLRESWHCLTTLTQSLAGC